MLTHIRLACLTHVCVEVATAPLRKLRSVLRGASSLPAKCFFAKRLENEIVSRFIAISKVYDPFYFATLFAIAWSSQSPRSRLPKILFLRNNSEPDFDSRER